MNKRFQSIVMLVLVLSSLKALAIVGGEPIPDEDPATFALVNIKMKNGTCTGTALTPTVVLTAAHCQDLLGTVQLVARIDSGKTSPCDVSQVVETKLAPGAVRELPFRVHAPDLLLVRLATPLCRVKPARLSETGLATGDVVWGAGHGRGASMFGRAERFEFRLIEPSEAEAAVSPMTDLARQVLSVGLRTYRFGLPVREASSFCYGDSGGPVYREQDGEIQVVGVNSAVLPNEALGASTCDRSYLQIMTPVAPLREWIESKIKEWSSL